MTNFRNLKMCNAFLSYHYLPITTQFTSTLKLHTIFQRVLVVVFAWPRFLDLLPALFYFVVYIKANPLGSYLFSVYIGCLLLIYSTTVDTAAPKRVYLHLNLTTHEHTQPINPTNLVPKLKHTEHRNTQTFCDTFSTCTWLVFNSR